MDQGDSRRLDPYQASRAGPKVAKVSDDVSVTQEPP